MEFPALTLVTEKDNGPLKPGERDVETNVYGLHPQAMAASAQLDTQIKLGAFSVSPCVWRGKWNALCSHTLTNSMYFSRSGPIESPG